MSNSNKLKPFHRLPCEELSQIQSEVIGWINSNRPDILTSDHLWNKCDTAELVRASTSLVSWCHGYGLKIKELAVTVVNKPGAVGLHIDELPVTAKINIPIQNTHNSYNRWYNIPKKTMDSCEPIVNMFGNKFYYFKNIDYSKLEIIDEVELTEPIVFNSQIAHNIVIGENCKMPRVVLACTFFNEPKHFLQTDSDYKSSISL